MYFKCDWCPLSLLSKTETDETDESFIVHRSSFASPQIYVVSWTNFGPKHICSFGFFPSVDWNSYMRETENAIPFMSKFYFFFCLFAFFISVNCQHSLILPIFCVFVSIAVHIVSGMRQGIFISFFFPVWISCEKSKKCKLMQFIKASNENYSPLCWPPFLSAFTQIVFIHSHGNIWISDIHWAHQCGTQKIHQNNERKEIEKHCCR